MNFSIKQLKKFKDWLAAQGSELLPLTNEFELIRFRCRLGTGVLYTGRKGISVSSQFVQDAIDCFIHQRKWNGKGKPSKRIMGSKIKRQLIDRDGNECFYCGKMMTAKEMTTEHIFSINQGGTNHIANMTLAHFECNQKAGHMTVVDKIKLRDKLRLDNN